MTCLEVFRGVSKSFLRCLSKSTFKGVKDENHIWSVSSAREEEVRFDSPRSSMGLSFRTRVSFGSGWSFLISSRHSRRALVLLF
ncbi:hypothetical protein YC2023_107230 [Brassica napus]